MKQTKKFAAVLCVSYNLEHSSYIKLMATLPVHHPVHIGMVKYEISWSREK